MSLGDFFEDIMKELGINYVEIFSYPCKDEKFSREEINELFKNYLEKRKSYGTLGRKVLRLKEK